MIKEASISILRFLPDEHRFSPCPCLRLIYTTKNNDNNVNNLPEEHILHINLQVNDINNDDDNDEHHRQLEQEQATSSTSQAQAWIQEYDASSSSPSLLLDFVLPRPSAAWMNEYRKWNYFGRNGIGHPIFSTSRDLRDFNAKGRMLVHSLTKELATMPFRYDDNHGGGGGGGVNKVVVTVNDFLDLYNLELGDWAAWWHVRDLNYPGLIVPIQQLPVSYELKSRLMMWRSMLGYNIHLYHNQQHIHCFNQQGKTLQRLIREELSGDESGSSHYDYRCDRNGPIPIVSRFNASINKNNGAIVTKSNVGDADDDDGNDDYITSDMSNSNSSSSSSSSEELMTMLWGSFDELSVDAPYTITSAPTVSKIKEEAAVESIDLVFQGMNLERSAGMQNYCSFH